MQVNSFLVSRNTVQMGRHRCKDSLARIDIRLSVSFLVLNSLPNDKIMDWSKLKAFADEIINVNEKLKFVFGRLENIVGKGENAGLPAFSPFPTLFSKGFFLRPGSLKVRIVW